MFSKDTLEHPNFPPLFSSIGFNLRKFFTIKNILIEIWKSFFQGFSNTGYWTAFYRVDRWVFWDTVLYVKSPVESDLQPEFP